MRDFGGSFFLPSTFPFVAIVAPVGGSLSMLDTFTGFQSLDEFYVRLLTVTEESTAILAEERSKAAVVEAERSNRCVTNCARKS